MLAACICSTLGAQATERNAATSARRLEKLRQPPNAPKELAAETFDELFDKLLGVGVLQRNSSISGDRVFVSEKWKSLTDLPTASEKVMILAMDGGPDRNVRYPRGIVAFLTVFALSGVDGLAAFNTAAYQSQRNLVERIMALINLRLAGMGLERGKMSDAAVWWILMVTDGISFLATKYL